MAKCFFMTWYLIICFVLFLFCTVICNFRSPICQALVLEIGETVQILEKSEGKISLVSCVNSDCIMELIPFQLSKLVYYYVLLLVLLFTFYKSVQNE